MDYPGMIASIPIAMESIQLLCKSFYLKTTTAQFIKHRLGILRTFLLCSTKFLSNDSTNGSQLGSTTRTQIMKLRLGILRTFLLCSTKFLSNDSTEGSQLGSLLVRAEDVVREILGYKAQAEYYTTRGDLEGLCSYYDRAFDSLLANMESLEEDIDKWFISASTNNCLQVQQVQANQVKDIADSVVENLDDFLSLQGVYVGVLVEPVEALKESITFLRNFICFVTLLCGENQEFQCLVTHIEPLAINTAHVALHLFSATHYNTEVFSTNSTVNLLCDDMKSMISSLQLRINLVDSPILHASYTRALKSLKHSSELYVRNLQMSDIDLLDLVKDFIVFLLSTTWEMLHLDTSPVVFLKDEFQAVYEGLRSLRAILQNESIKFDDNIRHITGAVICDAGFIIFSLYENDSVIRLRVKDFQEKIKAIQAELLGEKLGSRFKSPKNNVLGFLDFLLDYLVEVKISEVDSDIQNFVPEIREAVVFVRSFLGKLAELRKNQQEDLHLGLWNLSVDVAYRLEFLIDQLVLGKLLYSFSSSFQSVSDDIRTIQANSMKISSETVAERVNSVSTYVVPSLSPIADEVVGFVVERATVLDRLMRGSKKLQVVAIVGMPGLGKTTLASKVYNDPSVLRRFQARAWCPISQEFNKTKVLLDLLNQIRPGAGNSSMDEHDLAQEVRRSLKRRRYLIFLDDVWDAEAYHCLKEYFPDDSIESRILMTSRLSDVGILDEKPHLLRQLTVDESLELLKRKLFPGRDWPSSLYEIGAQIAEICKGVPLTVVIVSGLLTTPEEQVWNKVLESLRSGDISSLDQCMNTVELSYKQLPDHLKACFLSFGAYPEDEEVLVRRLIWLWVAEGFIPKSKPKSSEEVAEECVKILIRRSLLIISKETSRGGAKACRIHDLLREFCLRKANEENFFHVLKRYNELSFDDEFGDSCFDEPGGNMRRLCIYSKPDQFQKLKLFCPRLCSLSFFDQEWSTEIDVLFILRICRLLRVLDLEQVCFTEFPREIGLLWQLRYLAIQGSGEISTSIGNLSKLESLILCCRYSDIILPDSFWNLQKLRRLYLSPVSEWSSLRLPFDNLEYGYNKLLELESLSELSSPDWHTMEKQLQQFPNIRRLRGKLGSFNHSGNDSKAMSFTFLNQLESLSLSFGWISTDIEFIFPKTITKFSLSNGNLSWRRISSIAELPNLVVLKLRHRSFSGDAWHVEEGEFPKLKFLKLESLDLVIWTASDDQFPNLEKLVLNNCYKLEEIPDCLKDVATLKMIEVSKCRESVANLVRRVEDYQKEMGNSALQVQFSSTDYE